MTVIGNVYLKKTTPEISESEKNNQTAVVRAQVHREAHGRESKLSQIATWDVKASTSARLSNITAGVKIFKSIFGCLLILLTFRFEFHKFL